jgi:hypothetical protein
MDQPSGRSFMQVLCEKYSPENFPYRRGPGIGVHVPATPQGSPMKGKKRVYWSLLRKFDHNTALFASDFLYFELWVK